MRAHEVITEGHIPARFKKILKKKGYKFLGQGVDQAAFLAPDGGKVLKIFGSDFWDNSGHKMFFKWAKFCQKNADNPFLPKFSGFQKVNIPDERGDKEWFILMYQELLTTNNRQAKNVSEMSEYAKQYVNQPERWLLQNIKMTPEWRELSEITNVNKLFRTLMQLYRIGKRSSYGWDLHPGNVMFRRNGTPVVVDPWVVW